MNIRNAAPEPSGIVKPGVPVVADSWRATGKDSTGAENWTLGALIISKHPASGVNLYRKEGRDRVLVSIGFTSVEAARRYCERNGVAP